MGKWTSFLYNSYSGSKENTFMAVSANASAVSPVYNNRVFLLRLYLRMTF